jgi:transcriptional regulator with XRE-family HTH domain
MSPSLSQAFGLAVGEVRVARGLSQDALAATAGIDRAHIGHLERATKSPTLTTVEKLADALEVAPSRLFARAEEIMERDPLA